MKITHKLLIPLICILLTYCSSEDGKKRSVYVDGNPKTPFEKISETIAGSVPDSKMRAIVLTFVGQDGDPHRYGQIFAEKLTTELAKKKKMILLDRFVYFKKVKESGMSLHSTPDLQTIRQLGELLDVHLVVIGIVTPFTNGYELNCRAIEVKTGLIMGAEEGFYADRAN